LEIVNYFLIFNLLNSLILARLLSIFYIRLLQFLLICLFDLYFLNAKAEQTIHFGQLGRNEGLSQSSVNCILKDRDGFMWFGTQDGLNLYDGKKFRVFQNQPGDTNSIANNYIASICEDEEGFLWIGTMTGGLNRFDKNTERFKVFIHTEGSNSISDNSIWTVLAPGDSSVWIGTSKGLNRYDKKTGQFKTFTNNSDSTSLTTDMVVSLYKDRRGRLWIGTVKGLCMYDESMNNFIRYQNPYEKTMQGANIIWSITETSSGKIITGTNNGVYLLESVTGLFKLIISSFSEGKLVVWSVASQQDGIIWAGTDRGLFQFFGDNKYNVYLHEHTDLSSIADNNIWCVSADPSGIIWAGTKEGISKSKSSSTFFHLLNDKPGQQQKLSSSKVMAVLEDKQGTLWIGTDGGGLNCIKSGSNKTIVYNSANSGLMNDAVWALAEDSSGNIWIGNYQGGLHVFNKITEKIRSFPSGQNNPHALGNNRILALLSGNDGTIWIGTRGGGLFRLDPASEIFKSYQHSPNDSTSISENTVLSMAFDAKNRLWVGTYEGGLNMLIPGSDKFKSFKKNPEDLNSLSDNNIWSILFDKKGRLWLGTQGGLNYSGNPGDYALFKYLGTRDGLKSNTIIGLAEDDLGNIWMSNFNGLARLDIKAFESSGNQRTKTDFPGFRPLFWMFDTDNGLQGLEYNQGAYHKGYSGLLYFGGSNGLNYFSTEDAKESSFMPPVVITGLKILNKEVLVMPVITAKQSGKVKIMRSENNYFLPISISYIKELVLTYRENVISFEFASLDYSNPQKNQYAYKMVGFDNNWNYMGPQNSATYTNLSAGNYKLLIKGSNADGIWNPGETVLKITIIPPFWKSRGFIISLIIAILILTYLTLRWFFINQRRKDQKEKEFIELQLKTIKSQIDPHFAFNALNTIASFIYSEKPDITYDYFTRFAMMIRNILNDNEKISRSLSDELNFVKNYLELQKVRFNDRFDYFIQVDNNISMETQVPKMIIQTFAENSVKHGLMHRIKDGILKIDVYLENSCLNIIIEDNGVGRAKASELSIDSTQKGLKIIEQIIDLYMKLYHTGITQKIEDISDDDGNCAGTRVMLTLCEYNKSLNKNRFLKFGKRKIWS
jgi:ligand-binding sensor domain-containing protein